MSQMVIDTQLSEKLRALAAPVEFVDESGRVLGRYVPVSAGPRISEEELARRRQEPGGRTLAEIMADLEHHA